MMSVRGGTRRLLSGLTVAALVDREVLIHGTTRFRAGEGDRHVVNALRHLVKQVVVGPYTDAACLVSWLKDVSADVVFNLTEHAGGDRRKDAHICSLLELLKIPYTGAGPRSLMLCRDKAVSKMIAARAGFKTPEFFVTETNAPRLPSGIKFPLVVKPRYGDASEGINQSSFVRDRNALLRRIELLEQTDVAEVICEEYVAGRELLVGVLGSRVMPVRELLIGRSVQHKPRLMTYNMKHDKASRRRWQVKTDFAHLSAEQERAVKGLTRRTCGALELQDYARLDLKLTPSGEWFFLEANPNPGLVPFDRSLSGIWSGISYDELIERIILRALQRED
jgi:D-alanine-D-alanine ligase